jgi:3'(2'), 5'-bisphosphate nucleotidase
MLTTQDISYIKQLIIELGNVALKDQGTDFAVEFKYDNSPVTHVDKIISTAIVTALLKLTPYIPVVSEEEEIPGFLGDTFWLVDPIDGTKSYIRREDTYTINIGLIQNGTPEYGFIYQPAQKLLHYTDEDKALIVERDGQFVRAPETRIKGEWRAVISKQSRGQQMTELLELYNIKDVIHVPSSIKLCLVADGSADLYPRFAETMEWDIAAGHALIKASGGEIFDLSGRKIQYAKSQLRNKGFVACGANFLKVCQW